MINKTLLYTLFVALALPLCSPMYGMETKKQHVGYPDGKTAITNPLYKFFNDFHASIHYLRDNSIKRQNPPTEEQIERAYKKLLDAIFNYKVHRKQESKWFRDIKED